MNNFRVFLIEKMKKHQISSVLENLLVCFRNYPPRIFEAYCPRLPTESPACEWIGEVNKTRNSTYHAEGWKIFVVENGFKTYDFTAFRRDGGMLFRVKVFKGNGCPRKECFALAPSPLTARERNGLREECSTPLSSACTRKKRCVRP
ncbi:hypothetical protein MKW98_028363 [Papaver atlanticum]|uniref:TF-B3 domain-containing protein n=1 Tax=Papaver atlanticum TaxID=357466 RepID=A0AAD4SW40_9MAGN|nr:hypothetical protein MKW98_028363 [Papaver atlanticum]